MEELQDLSGCEMNKANKQEPTFIDCTHYDLDGQVKVVNKHAKKYWRSSPDLMDMQSVAKR